MGIPSIKAKSILFDLVKHFNWIESQAQGSMVAVRGINKAVIRGVKRE